MSNMQAIPTTPIGFRNTLCEEFAPLFRRLIRQYGNTPELRQELPGEIYVRFCALLDAYEPKRGVPLYPYLVRQLTAAVYTYARSGRRQQRHEVALEMEDGHERPLPAQDPTPGWHYDLATRQMAKGLPEALAALPKRQRQVVILRYYEDRSFVEIADMLGVQPATARSLLRHGLNKLRCWAQEWNEG